MKYVYKIVGNFTNENFEKILSKISKKFIYMYVDKTLYISLKSWQDYEESEDLVNKTFKPVRDFYIEEINEQNVVNQHQVVKDWCLNNLVKLDTERYQYENQAKLKQVWQDMDKMEAELTLQLQQKIENKEKRKEV